MNQKTALKSLLLVATAALGLAASARAGEGPETDPAAYATSLGLLGQTYTGFSFSHIHLDDAPVNADSYGLEYSRSLRPGWDAVFNYDWAQSRPFAGERAREQTLTATLREFVTTRNWGKPYVEAGVGYDWLKFAGVKDNSFVWLVAAGVEFQAAPAVTITPFVRYTRTDGYDDEDAVNYGVKANYWVTRRWAVTAGIDRNDDKDMTYKVGVNLSF